MPTPSWTVSFTMPTASNSPAKACAGHEANRTRRLDQPPSPVTQIIGQRGSRPGRHHSVTVGDIIQESRATSSHYTRATSSESALFGVGFVLAPGQVLANYGIELSPALALVGRLFGGALLTFGVILC